LEQPDHSTRVTLLHHLTGHDHVSAGTLAAYGVIVLSRTIFLMGQKGKSDPLRQNDRRLRR
jgi:hypothetical protein